MYFVVDVSCDGASLRQSTKEEILAAMAEGELIRSDQNLVNRLPGRAWDLMAEPGVMIIKGEIVVPKEKKVVTEYELP
jgi:hypothetical protein